MARIHGRNGICYFGLASGAAASPIAYLSDWSINFTVDTVDVTAMGDANHLYVAGLPDCQGDFTGFYDDASVQTYTAATDGVPRNFYLYPSTLTPGQYWFGQILADFSLSGGVAAAVGLKSTWKAATAFKKVG
jgi:hypothetical protein